MPGERGICDIAAQQSMLERQSVVIEALLGVQHLRRVWGLGGSKSGCRTLDVAFESLAPLHTFATTQCPPKITALRPAAAGC